MALADGTLFGMGNPLLDIMVNVEDSFLTKYNLKPNDAIIAEDAHVPMYKELIENYHVEFVAGGATQNVLRVVQWIVDQPNVTTFMGAVGNDENGKTLANSATAAGVNVQYQIVPDLATGTCAALITGTHRSLCAYLAAANHFTKSHLDKPENYKLMEKANFYYISGFFLTVSPDSLLAVAKHAAAKNLPFMFNLSAPFIPQFFTDKLNDAIPYVDVLFGNETEARAFSEVQKFGTDDIKEIALNILKLPKVNTQRPRLVVITQGCDPVIVVQATEAEPTVLEFPINKLSAEQIKDTNGAGDAFVGGFLAQYIKGKTISECVECGNWAACEVIQQQGCTFPKNKKFPSK
jgi:adenosine kinase